MKPESILQSDLLDILFENRNKEYGAYSLRKNYSNRLSKSIAFTFSLVFFLSLAWYVKANYFKSATSLVGGQKVEDVHLDPLSKTDEPKKEEKPKAVTKKPVAQVAHPTIKIVPDNEADKPVPEIADFENKAIGLVNVEGEPSQENDLFPPSDGDAKGGAEIEPKKEEPVAETGPLMHAEIMPEFPGGPEGFKRYMLKNLREPELEEGQKVVVIVRFIVEPDGSIENAVIVKSGGDFDEEVLDVVKRMPRWKPGMQNGQTVPVYFSLPVTFTGPEN